MERLFSEFSKISFGLSCSIFASTQTFHIMFCAALRQDWPLWFEAHGVAAPNCKKGPAFSENHLIVRAAVAGQGLALVRDIYAEDDLRSKKLVRPLIVNWPVRFAYYVVATSDALQKLAVRRFRDWLVEEAGHEIQSPTSTTFQLP